MRYLVVGDIHGCYDEFRELLDKAGLGWDDPIIAIGDIVDRGPDSAGVLRFFQQTPNARSLKGNHEDKHVRSFRGEAEPALSQVLTRRHIGEADYPAAVTFMEAMPHYLDLPDALLVHAFYEPGVPLSRQRDEMLIGREGAQEQLRKWGGLWEWYKHYDGTKPLIIGHKDYSGEKQPFVYQDRVYGIDTRCYENGALTGLLLPDFRFISVPSRGDYWTALQYKYADLLTQYEAK
jgi:serine/threonine protein phosphatase 1